MLTIHLGEETPYFTLFIKMDSTWICVLEKYFLSRKYKLYKSSQLDKYMADYLSLDSLLALD